MNHLQHYEVFFAVMTNVLTWVY